MPDERGLKPRVRVSGYKAPAGGVWREGWRYRAACTCGWAYDTPVLYFWTIEANVVGHLARPHNGRSSAKGWEF